VSNCDNNHVSCSPRFHPGRSVFPSPVGDHSLSVFSLPVEFTKLSACSHSPVLHSVCCIFRLPSSSFRFPGSVALAIGSMKAHYGRESLCLDSTLPLSRNDWPSFYTHVTRCSLLLRTHAPNLLSLLTFTFQLCVFSLCRLLQAPADHRLFPALSLTIFPEMSDSVPRCFLRVHFLISTSKTSAFSRKERDRQTQNPVQQLQYGSVLRGCKYSLMFKPLHLLATLVARTTIYLQ